MTSHKQKLMIVDNEIDVCNFVKSFFEIRGLDVIIALNGDEGLKVLDHGKIDIMILDVAMRHENEGVDFLPRLREKAPHAKIIMITGRDDKETIAECKKLGANDYVTKPLVLENLEATVLGKSKKRA